MMDKSLGYAYPQKFAEGGSVSSPEVDAFMARLNAVLAQRVEDAKASFDMIRANAAPRQPLDDLQVPQGEVISPADISVPTDYPFVSPAPVSPADILPAAVSPAAVSVPTDYPVISPSSLGFDYAGLIANPVVSPSINPLPPLSEEESEGSSAQPYYLMPQTQEGGIAELLLDRELLMRQNPFIRTGG